MAQLGEIMPVADDPKSLPAVLTDAKWSDIIRIVGIDSPGASERFELEVIISDFRHRARRQDRKKHDGRSPSEIRRELVELSNLARKLSKGIRGLPDNEHALAAISAAMYAVASNIEERRPRDNDQIFLQQMSAQIKLIDNDLDFQADLEHMISGYRAHSIIS